MKIPLLIRLIRSIDFSTDSPYANEKIVKFDMHLLWHENNIFLDKYVSISQRNKAYPCVIVMFARDYATILHYP